MFVIYNYYLSTGFRPTEITEGTESTESTECNEYFRLVGDNSSNMQGMVESCYSTDANVNMWGPLCVDGITTWSQFLARAFCQFLGLPYTGKTTTALAQVGV